jgi:membrane-bound lytic murein transglycosylase D
MVEEPPAPRPAWLTKAERAYAEGLAARKAGDGRTARKRFTRAMKILTDNADDETLSGLEDEVAALLAKLEGPPPAPAAEPVGPPPTLTVTERELEAAQPAAAPAVAVDEKKAPAYAVPINPDDPVVKKYIALYTTQPQYRSHLQAAFDRMSLYKDMVLRHLKDAGLPRELVYLPLVESEYQPSAASRAGAVGLWQFMALTGRNTGLQVNYWVDERLDPVKCTKAAVSHLKELHDWFQDWPLALAAYNRGIYGLAKDMEFTRSPDFAAVARRQGLPTETELYVPKFMALTLIGDNAAAYGFAIPAGHPPPPADEITLNKPLDLKIAAQCAGVSESQIRALNPILRLWCTPKNDAAFVLRLPRGTREKTLAALAQVKDWTPASELIKHRVKQGDYLGKIAARYKTSVESITRDNRLTNPKRLRPGQVLLIRPGRGYRGD